MLPRMIQMGICDSSGLEISNVICKETASKYAAAAGCVNRVGRGWGRGTHGTIVGMLSIPPLWEDAGAAGEDAHPTHQ